MFKKTIILFLFLSGLSYMPADAKYNVLDYNVKSDGKQLTTHDIQKVIELCSEDGGGIVYFPAGEYLTGSLILRSGVYLELGPNAKILGSKDIKDYTTEFLISADNAANLGIIGQGTINGQGRAFWENKQRPYVRPGRLINFSNCEYVEIRNVNLYNSPAFHIALSECNYVWIDGVSIISDREAPNTDGIDPISSSNVFISNCYINTGDDAICLKSHGNIPTENIVVENCILISDDSAIKLGTGSEAPIRNCTFNNIIIRDTQCGIGFYAKDGGIFQNIRFSNITIETPVDEILMDDRPSRNYAIFMDLEKRTPDSPLSQIKDIYFNDITIDSKDASCLFLGQPDQKIENLFLTNIHYKQYHHVSFQGNKKPRGTRTLTDRAANDYSHIPSNFTFAHVRNLTIQNLTIHDYADHNEYQRHMIWGMDLENVNISHFQCQLAQPNVEKAQMFFNNSSGISITNSEPGHTQASFLELEGEQTSKVSLMFNDFSNVGSIVKIGSEVIAEEVFEEFNRK